MTELTVRELQWRAHDNAIKKGFYDDPPSIAMQIALMHSELSEMLEADRKGDFENYKQECADVFIRLLDHCGNLGIDLYAETIKKMEYNESRPYMHGGKKY